jgi:hypothetical protein
MTTRTVPDLKELFKQASEIAQQVPANMQEAAFNRALELLTAGTVGQTLQASPAAPAKKSTARTANRGAPATPAGEDVVSTLLTGIDSTQHPGVASATTALDRALMVLKIALDEHNIDGLAAGDIARVLRDKFRVPAAENAIRMALSRASALVDRTPNGGGFAYRIMSAGEAHLVNLANPVDSQSTPARRVQRPGKRKSKSAAKVADQGTVQAPTKKASKAPVAAKRAAGQPGPKAAVLELISDKFFDTPKTGQVVQAHLKSKRGFNYGTAQLRVALLRLVREKALSRDANGDGDYEYKRT